ncbi:MAG: DUF2147 domain-containing protein [Hyphomicrobiaceae bacterium]
MLSKNFVGAFTAMTALLTFGQQANAASDPTGVWLNNTGRGAIEIKHCGKKLCGHVVWTKSKKDTKGCGKKIIGNVSRVGKTTWDNGWIYSPERRRKFSVELKKMKSGKLRVVGYAGSKFFSKTMYWKPAPADLVRCDKQKSDPQIEAKAKPPKKVAKTPPKKTNDRNVASIDRDDKEKMSNKSSAVIIEDDMSETDDTADTSRNSEDDEYAYNDDEDDENVKVGKLSLDDLPLDKFFKRTKSGRCKLNTPWIKLDFNCKN